MSWLTKNEISYLVRSVEIKYEKIGKLLNQFLGAFGITFMFMISKDRNCLLSFFFSESYNFNFVLQGRPTTLFSSLKQRIYFFNPETYYIQKYFLTVKYKYYSYSWIDFSPYNFLPIDMTEEWIRLIIHVIINSIYLEEMLRLLCFSHVALHLIGVPFLSSI